MTRDTGKTSPDSGARRPPAPDGHHSRPFPAFLRGRPLALLGILLAASWGSALPAQEEHEGVRKTYETVRASFLGIEITLRKKTRLEKAELEDETLDADDQRLQQLREAEQPLEAWGVAVDKNLILIAEKGLKESDIERIRVTDSTGASFEAVLTGVGRRHDFVLLKPTSPRELTPLSFAEWTKPALGETFHVTFADRVDHQWHLNVSPYILTNAPLVESPDWFCIDVMRPGSVISDRKGETVGIALDQYLWVTKDGRSSFLGKSILADDRLGDLEKRFDPFRKPLLASVKRIEILFRSEKPAERYMPSDEPRAGKATVFGVAVDDQGTLFVPEDLGRDAIRKIDDVAVIDEGTRLPAAFVGSFRAFGGFLVRAEGLKTTAGIVRDGKAPPAGEILFTATFEDRFGASRIKFDYNRLFRVEPGLGGVARIQPRKRIKEGSFLLDSAGRIVGVSTVDRKEEDLDDVAIEASRERYYTDRYRPGSGGGEHLRRLLFFSEIAPFLDHPAPQFDPRAVPMTKKEEKKLVWLGVEYQEISKPVADALGIQGRDQTNDGRRGLIVTEVYAGSPAEKAGLRPDDVLLTLRPEGESPRDLVGEPDRFGGMSRGMPYGPGRGGFVTPWKPTRNYLTTMLTEVGASKKVTFQVLRGKAPSDVSLTLDYAPIDYDAAERYKDEMLGLTAKELTYEVRQFHKLEAAASGVVVARVESGGKADVGKLQPLSIVTRVNNVAVRDLEHFRQLVSSTKNVTMTTIAYGQTKLVELARD